MEDKPRCAYHEAGHCVLAFSIMTGLVRSVTIIPPGAPPNNQWQGCAVIRWDWLDDPQEVAVIAVAGILAEAKASALELPQGQQPIGGVTLQVNQDLLNQFDELYDANHFGNAAQNSWPVQVPVGAGGVAEPAAISRDDLERIAPPLRNQAALQPLLQYACDFFNNVAWWRGVSNLAGLLNVDEPIPVIRSFAAYAAIHSGLRVGAG